MANEAIVTPAFTAAFTSVFKPKGIKGDPSAPLKYSVAMLFPKGDKIEALRELMLKAAHDKWGKERAEKYMANPKFKNPIKDQGDMAEQYAGFVDGAVYIQASNSDKPGLIDNRNQDIIDEDDFYSGCLARAQVQCYAWEHPVGGKGCSFSLLNVQKLRDGERLGGGRAKAQNVVEPVEWVDDGSEAPAKPKTADSIWD